MSAVKAVMIELMYEGLSENSTALLSALVESDALPVPVAPELGLSAQAAPRDMALTPVPLPVTSYSSVSAPGEVAVTQLDHDTESVPIDAPSIRTAALGKTVVMDGAGPTVAVALGPAKRPPMTSKPMLLVYLSPEVSTPENAMSTPVATGDVPFKFNTKGPGLAAEAVLVYMQAR